VFRKRSQSGKDFGSGFQIRGPFVFMRAAISPFTATALYAAAARVSRLALELAVQAILKFAFRACFKVPASRR
jgi:hypothetical protein